MSQNPESNCKKEDYLKPVTMCNLVKFYIPLTGVVSYTALSVNIMNPTLRLFADKDISNLLLVNSLVGTGAYIFTREHVKRASANYRITYSVTGALLLSFGSVLIWSVLRSLIPSNQALFTVTGIGTSLAFVNIGRNYLNHIDKLIEDKKN